MRPVSFISVSVRGDALSRGWEAEGGSDLLFLTPRRVSHPTDYFHSPVLTPLTVTKSKSHQTPPLEKGRGGGVITAAIKAADLTGSVQFSRPPRAPHQLVMTRRSSLLPCWRPVTQRLPLSHFGPLATQVVVE